MGRASGEELRALLDPDGGDPAMRKKTMLAHSMGGLIAKALVVEPRDAFWKAAFNVPPGELVLSASDREDLNDAFEWKPDPSVHRIIHLAGPHVGSNSADNAAGLSSWDMFAEMLVGTRVVIPPGSGFGSAGEGDFHISAFNSRANVEEVCRRLKALVA